MAAMLQSWLMNLGPYGAGAATAAVLQFVPLPQFAINVANAVPYAVWYGGAGYLVSTPGQDQGAAVLKAIAGGIGTQYVIKQMND